MLYLEYQEEEGKKGVGGEECEKDKIMTEKEDQTVSGLAQSRDLFESQEEDNLKRSQYCVWNNILCDCDENPESKSLLDNCCCLLYTSPSPRDATLSRMPSSA